MRVADAGHPVAITAQALKHQSIRPAPTRAPVSVQISRPQSIRMLMPVDCAEAPLTNMTDGQSNTASFGPYKQVSDSRIVNTYCRRLFG